MRRRLCVIFLLAAAAPAADLGPALLAAARRGDTPRIQKLIAQGAPVDARDKDGHTPLMLAAQRGHADAVRLLLANGAHPDLRGFRLGVQARVASGEIYSSCFLRPPELARLIADLKLDTVVLKALWLAAHAPPGGPVELALDGPAQATLSLRIRPSAACRPGQSADDVRLAIDATLTRGGAAIWEKTFGGGLKGLNAQSVASAAQYRTVFDAWAKAHAAEMYWGAVGTLCGPAR